MKNREKWWGLILVLLLSLLAQFQVVQATGQSQTQIGVTIEKTSADADQLMKGDQQIPNGEQVQTDADAIMPKVAAATPSGVNKATPKQVTLEKATQVVAKSLRQGRLPQTGEAGLGLMVIIGGMLLLCWLLVLVVIWQWWQSREGRETQ
ncbi:LPXTG cell wall anchor domain-containing protein [Lactiplantibacillus nangangensis]|uniref:LPXTG cell wall anchor domain-containing protein n=1 Tax=Lactiplantibacillus nangangensis TaxID=2559917 RepID=A0ABW1SLP5_9LACO|nr:LPXTG cell wall anchor domain-containing protein [Lactiplantibacillus nangangensis]